MNYESFYRFFEVIGNQTRLKIISTLISQSLSVGQICETIKEEQSKVSHNLKILSECNIVKSIRDGKKNIYSINSTTIKPILNLVEEHVNNSCNGQCHMCTKRKK